MHDTYNLDLNKMQRDFEAEKQDGKAILDQLATMLEWHWQKLKKINGQLFGDSLASSLKRRPRDGPDLVQRERSGEEEKQLRSFSVLH